MTINEIRKYLNTCLNKDSSGNSLSPQELNILLEANIFSFVRNLVLTYRQYLKSGTPTDDAILTAMLVDSLSKQTTATLTAGAFTLPNDFMFMNDLYGTYNASLKRIEMVSPEEYPKRTHNLLSKPIAYYPIAFINNTSCKVYPANMTAIYVDYIAKPAIPIFGYYTDANYQIVYLAAAATHTLTAGEYGSAGQTSGTTVTSLTVELDIPEESHIKFADFLLSKIAIRDRDAQLYQASENEINKEI